MNLKSITIAEAEIQVSFIQLKPILDIFLRGFSLSSCPQHRLKVLLLLNPMSFFKLALSCEQNFSYLDPDSPTFKEPG
jgi:hypothetical protein